MADTPASNSGAFEHVGSTPTSGTQQQQKCWQTEESKLEEKKRRDRGGMADTAGLRPEAS